VADDLGVTGSKVKVIGSIVRKTFLKTILTGLYVKSIKIIIWEATVS